MVVCIVKLNNNVCIEQFVKDTNNRLMIEDPIRNPFIGRMYITKDKELDYLSLVVQPIYPNISFYGWGLCLLLFAVFGWHWYVLLPAFIGALGIFYTPIPYYIGFVNGLRKVGYKDKIKLASSDELIEVLLTSDYGG